MPQGDKPLYDLDNAHEHFEAFIQRFNKQYPNEHEKLRRLEIFKKNLEDVNRRNTDHNELAVFGITKFLDLTEEEFLQMHTGFVPSSDNIPRVRLNTTGVQAPDSFDWRSRNVVGEVKNQGTCGSCWAFATIGSIESAYAISHGQVISLSEQQLVDCDTNDRGCGGGYPVRALSSLMSMGGVETEEAYPYVGAGSQCQFDASKVSVKVTNCNAYSLSQENEDTLKEHLYSAGPIALIVDATVWQKYTGGILPYCTNSLNHAVLLVGYGTENGSPYWIIKNSWGADWGEQGYIRLPRGVNACGLMNDNAASAVVA